LPIAGLLFEQAAVAAKKFKLYSFARNYFAAACVVYIRRA
jgi:hypothetical protein